MGLLAFVLWRLRDQVRPGGLFALYLVVGGLERFLVEFVRRNEPSVAGLTTAQLISVAMVAGGIAYIWALQRRGGLMLDRPAPRSATA